MVLNADAVVVGAGVIGTSTALELARAGLRVVVVDRLGAPGQGSTSASSAIVRFNYSTAASVATAWEARHCWEKWADHLGHADEPTLAVFRRVGLVLLGSPGYPTGLTTQLFDQVGVPYETWSPATLAARVPGIHTGRFWPPKRLDDPRFWSDPVDELGALFTPDAGFVDDAHLATLNLAAAAHRAGVTFCLGREVVAIRRRHDRVAGVDLADGDRVDAPVVVNAAGPWSSRVNGLAGVGADFAVTPRPMRQEVHRVDAPPGYGEGERLGPVIADLDLGVYLRPTRDGGLLVGGTEPECDPLQWLDDADTASAHPSQALFEAQVIRAARRFPQLRVPVSASGIAGVYDVTQDWTPIYDRTCLDGFYVAIGTSGNQFKNAPVVGAFMATIVMGVENGHDHDRQPLRYRGAHTALTIDLGAFSRRRAFTADAPRSVLG